MKASSSLRSEKGFNFLFVRSLLTCKAKLAPKLIKVPVSFTKFMTQQKRRGKEIEDKRELFSK